MEEKKGYIVTREGERFFVCVSQYADEGGAGRARGGCGGKNRASFVLSLPLFS